MLYVAYGSNMNLKQMEYRCPNSRVVCNGKLVGWKLIFNIHADIIETNDIKDVVPVVVWDIADEDWDRLDMYEGYPSYYIKKDVAVVLDDNTNNEAVVYVMAEHRRGIARPYADYYNCIKEGYKENGIDTKYLIEALEYSYHNETEYNKYNTRRG